ncbi:MAG: hydrolase [Gammaproteobacteria bacterium]|nr:hydrolase [Gammaproteobacteria bacterium]
MLMDKAQSTLLIIDLQQRLMPAIEGGDSVVEKAAWLCRLAGMLEVPMVLTEQYPKGLGPTLEAVREQCPAAERVEKLCFSAAAEPALSGTILGKRDQVVICGAETHVCVLQSAIELQRSGKQVFVVEEAVGSRTANNKALALSRMRGAGIEVVTTEMVAFEWLRRAGSDAFRQVSRELIR